MPNEPRSWLGRLLGHEVSEALIEAYGLAPDRMQQILATAAQATNERAWLDLVENTSPACELSGLGLAARRTGAPLRSEARPLGGPRWVQRSSA